MSLETLHALATETPDLTRLSAYQVGLQEALRLLDMATSTADAHRVAAANAHESARRAMRRAETLQTERNGAMRLAAQQSARADTAEREHEATRMSLRATEEQRDMDERSVRKNQ